MSMTEILTNLITFFQNAAESLCNLTTWLWTPWEPLQALTGAEIAPIAIFSTGVLLAIVVLHIAHLVNVIAG